MINKFLFVVCFALPNVYALDVCRDILEGKSVEHPIAEVNKCYECSHKAIGMEWGLVSDISASGSYSSFSPSDVNFGNPNGAWCSEPDTFEPHLQIRFGKTIKFGSLKVQGSPVDDYWVKSLQIQYQASNGSFVNVVESIDTHKAKIFPASKDCDGPVEVKLVLPISTPAIRIIPVDYNGKPCLRVEVNGCSQKDVMENQQLPNKLTLKPKCDLETKNCPIGCPKFATDENGCQTCDCVAFQEIRPTETFEGDILLNEETHEAVERILKPEPEYTYQEGVQNKATKVFRKWDNIPSGKNYIVPYDDSRMDSRGKAALQQAVEEFNRYTCIRLRRRTNQREYLQLFVGGGCYSPIGRSSSVNQVSIGNGCQYKGTVVHEILHSLGFWHEQSRPDRDTAVNILWQNIPQGVQYNFQKQSTSNVDTLGFAYDIGSVMHYDGYAFSNNGRPTITDKRGNPIRAQRSGMSKSDYQQLNKLYRCDGGGGGGGVTTTTKPSSNCEDENTNCPYWAKRSECSKNPKYMLVFCKRSCKQCSSITKPITTTTTTKRKTTKPPTITTSSTCSDDYSVCERWAAQGDCEKYSGFMLKRCKKSCKQCPGELTPPPTTTTKAPKCKDKLTYCSGYKTQCKDSIYADSLKIYCKATCNYC